MPPPSVATVKSSHMSDKIRNAPTLGPGDSLSQMSRKSSQVDASHISKASKSHISGMSGYSRHGAPSHLSAVPEMSTASASSNMSNGSKMPSHLSWAPMSHVSGGSTPQSSSRHSRHAPVLDSPPPSSKGSNAPWFSDENARSAYQAMTHSQGSSASNASRGQGSMHAPSRHTGAPSYVMSGAAGPSGSHRTSAPLSMVSNMSGQSNSSSGSRQPEFPMSGASGASGRSHISSSSRQSASPGSQAMSMTQHGGRTSHRSVVPSPLGQAPVHQGMRGKVSTPAPRPGETVEVNINIRTTRR
ncbi:uncharacterized protein H6S33_006158 [Morchella sextelata]|uniref:uncharacterized protein n=1 Tax=Morchella sextelata TaxID=1174677 RepID=UPI001D03E442|nr:uncharacterized protein H6S33_006158 [Morchella sextelata]KAH0614272.1 hypothetical protein H6S33_006158 [Morchella sextelata]